jgi:uncharacterized delta-60 repeat protein
MASNNQKIILAVLFVILITGCPDTSGTYHRINAQRIAETTHDQGLGITTLSDNSTVVTGYFNGSATFGPGELNQTVLNSAASRDIFIARYNPDGTLAWVKKPAGGSFSSGSDEGDGITTLSDNSTVVTGLLSGSATFGEGEPNQTVLTSAGGSDIFIARYNLDGTLAWAKRAGSDRHVEGKGITSLSDNSIVVTGWFYDTAIFGSGEPNQTILTSPESYVIFIARYNPDGTLVWAKYVGGTSVYDEMGNGITTLSDDSTVMTGVFSGAATFGSGEPNQTVLTSSGERDIFIARYNPDGSLAWAKLAGGPSNDFGNAITVLSDDSTVVTGRFEISGTFGFNEPNKTILTADRYNDIFIARYNPDGTLAWVKRAGGAKYDEGNGITTLSDDSTVVTGWFDGSATFGPGEPNETALTSAGDLDIFIARYNPDGTLAWVKSAGGDSGLDHGIGITSLSDNSTVLTGEFYGSASFGLGEPNQTVLASAAMIKDITFSGSWDWDIFIARYNSDGSLAWAKRAGGAGYDSLF